MVNNETFFAWLDGELSPDEAARVEADVARNPELKALAEQHRAMQSGLKGALDRVAEAPVPVTLLAAVRKPETPVIDFGAAKRARERRLWGSGPQWAAMAATLAIGIFVGTQVPIPAHAPVQVQEGRIYAAAALDEALDTELAGAPSKSPVRIGLTFRDQSGEICRSFTEGPTSGLACRKGERWQLRGLFAAPEGQAGEYRMAAGMDPNLAALIDSAMTGEPFDAGQEKAAREKGWR
jgi:negative regulator of sigma E activity